jgi:subtilase family serine protease
MMGRPAGVEETLSRHEWMQASSLHLRKKRVRIGRGAAVAMTAACVVVGGTSVASAATAAAAPGGRALLAGTMPVSTSGTSAALAAGSQVQLSVFVGQNQAGLAAAATAVSSPHNPSYGHYLSPAQVQARFGATAAQQSAVRAWLTGSGLSVTHDDAFVITAEGTAAKAEAAVQASLALNRPANADAEAQVLPGNAMSIPSALASTISTIRVSTAATIASAVHEPQTAPTAPTASATATATATVTATATATPTPTPTATSTPTAQCSAYYGQQPATGLPQAYGRTIDWAPCGYTPSELRAAYGATASGLTGAGTTVAVLSLIGDPTALSDANEWSQQEHVPPFAPGQFTSYVAANAGGGYELEPAMDIEAVHGMAPAAKVDFVAGDGSITGDALLDSLDTVVQQHLASVVSDSWYEVLMSLQQTPASMITSWESVLQQAALEGITVDAASGDFGSLSLQYPTSDPWLTSVGGTTLAIGANDNVLWQTGWASQETTPTADGQSWTPLPTGQKPAGSTGGVSENFAEPFYQEGVVSGNTWNGQQMRAVPDVSAFGDPAIGYQVGLSVPDASGQNVYQNAVNAGTSLSAPLFAGFEADLIQGREGIALGFANPLLYASANTPAFRDITADPQGSGYTEAVVYQPGGTAFYQPPLTLDTEGQCGTGEPLVCGRGYDMVTGIGAPGPAFFNSFGSHAR